MKTKYIFLFVIFSLFIVLFLSCEGMAELFHGPKPEETFSVTFNANGAIGTPPETQPVSKGSVVSLPDKGGLNSPGNIFVGWSESSAGAGTIYSVGSSVTVSRNMVFFAQWLDSSTPQYTVTFNPNGAASGSPPAPQIVYSGISITIPGHGTLAQTGKVFGGWNTQSNGGGTNYAAGAAYKVTGNVTLYAKWNSEIQYTLTYHANGGSGAVPAAQTVDPGTEITIQGEGALTYTGRKFGGWNTQSNGMGTNYAAGETYTVTGNATLYARWLEQYTVTFHANGASGTVPASQMVDPGTVIALPGQESMNYTGRIFKGWNTQANGSGTGYEESGMYAVNENVTLYAQWEAVPIVPPGSTLVQQLAWIANQAGDGVVYDIVINNDAYIQPTTVSTMGRNITVNIHSTSSTDIKTLYLDNTGAMFTISNNITLELKNIKLVGRSLNTFALVDVSQGGNLIIESGAVITQNSSNRPITSEYVSQSGGVYVFGGGTLIMNGGSITGNTTLSCGGGVNNHGTFTMNGGIISNNTCLYQGGGVANYGIFTMRGGVISGNKQVTGGGGGGWIFGGGGVFSGNNTLCTFTKTNTPGSNTSGVIYGAVGPADMVNTVVNRTNGGGDAVLAYGIKKARNSTLGEYDEISTLNQNMGWE